MKVIIVSEAYLEQRFEALKNRLKLEISHMNYMDESGRQQTDRTVIYHIHEFKKEIIEGPDRMTTG